MSSEGSLKNKNYVQSAYLTAMNNDDFVIGFICQSRLTSDPRFVHFTPGVSVEQNGDALGQQYNSPENAIQNGADVLIVGRAITNAPDPVVAAKTFKDRGYAAYESLTVV